MADQVPTQQAPPDSAEPTQVPATQLTQARVPLEQAGDTLSTHEANGRTPIVVLTSRNNRAVNSLLIAGGAILLLSLAAGVAVNNVWIGVIGVVLGLAVLISSIVSSFYATIPEGANALVIKRGKYDRTLGPGRYFLAPYYIVSSLVTRREIPFVVPVAQAPTMDNVRASVEALVSFAITDPHKFVYNISASDFDLVLQASGQRVLRSMIHNLPIEDVTGLTGMDTSRLLAELTEDMERYGVAVTKVNISYAAPPPDFLMSQEARRLAGTHQAEQVERQALAQRRQADQEALALQATAAQVERQRQEIQVKVQEAEALKHIVGLQADAEDLRFSRLQERLERYPEAADWDVASARLDIARGLATNTRAVVEVGHNSDIARVLAMRDIIQEDSVRSTDTAGSGNGAVVVPRDAEAPATNS